MLGPFATPHAHSADVASAVACCLHIDVHDDNDNVHGCETGDDLIKRLNEWKDNMVNRGMRVNMNKSKVATSEHVKN